MTQKLKELTRENHKKAERSFLAKKLVKGMEPEEYYDYLYNQFLIYQDLENLVNLPDVEHVKRAELMKEDLKELEDLYGFKKAPSRVCPVVKIYFEHLLTLEQEELLAHVYVRHFGDMSGGQIIKRRVPGKGKMYEFDNVELLKDSIRRMLHDDMAEEANRCFEFAMQLFSELENKI
tara:strand:- start:41 stop:571 length:531 start_codon:yes stop_codon:yes gene_type:complete